jgi:ArsR family transcriptional regulator
MKTSLNTEKSYENLSELFKAMANVKRLKLLYIISNGEVTVNEISRILKVRKSNTSQHLKLLKLMGLVTARRQGKNVFYKVSSTKIMSLLKLFP